MRCKDLVVGVGVVITNIVYLLIARLIAVIVLWYTRHTRYRGVMCVGRDSAFVIIVVARCVMITR